MGPPPYMRSVVGRNVVIRRMAVSCFKVGSYSLSALGKYHISTLP